MVIESEGVTVQQAIPAGHKLAVRALRVGDPILRYGQIIGFASQPIAVGDHVHVHNVVVGEFQRDYAVGTITRRIDYVHPAATFRRIVRADGRIATRNCVGILATVNCSATVAQAVASHFDIARLEQWPTVDGVVALAQQLGCCIDGQGEGLALLRRTIAGYARHPNFGGIVIVGLGCETSDHLTHAARGLAESDRLRTYTIQEAGGTSKAIATGVRMVTEMLLTVAQITRRAVPASHLTIGLECGGSDGYSGVTANPALGAAADMIVRHGGTAALSETLEIYGAEHLLTRREKTQSERLGYGHHEFVHGLSAR